MKRAITLFQLALIALPLLPIAAAAGGVSLSTDLDGTIVARDQFGAVLWKKYAPFPGEAPDSAAAQPFAAQPLAAQPPATPPPTWDPLTVLNPLGTSFTGPVFDSSGNAWMIVSDGVTLSAYESIGSTGLWQTPHVIGPALQSGITQVGLTTDLSGGVYVVYSTAKAGDSVFPLYWTKFTPSSGWQASALAYTSPVGFSEVFSAIDSAGRLVVVFNAGVASIVYDPVTKLWGPPQIFATPSQSPVLPSIATNASRSRLVLVFGFPNLVYSFFNSSTGQWNPVAPIPNGQDGTFFTYSTLNSYPLAMDAAGNITLVYNFKTGFRIGVAGFRYENGTWTRTQLQAGKRTAGDVGNFGSIAVNSSGAVLVSVVTNLDANDSAVTIYRYTPGKGWKTETAATYASTTGGRSRVAWLGSGDAVVAYYDTTYTPSDPLQEERAAVYSNGRWSDGPPIPGGYSTLYPGIATALDGSVLLGMSGEFDPYFGIVVTWLRP